MDICQNCQKELIKNANKQKYHKECAKLVKIAYIKEYQKRPENAARIKEIIKKYHERPEIKAKVREYQKQYRKIKVCPKMPEVEEEIKKEPIKPRIREPHFLNGTFLERHDPYFYKAKLEEDNKEMERFRTEYKESVKELNCLYCGHPFIQKNDEDECVECTEKLKNYKGE